MTQLIKLIFINIILFVCSNCNEKKNKNFANLNEIAIDSGVKETKHTDTTAIPIKTNLNDNWICYKYIADTRYEQKYGDEYAQEISNFSNFKIKNKDYEGGADEMADVTNGGTVGLIKRRKAEINMFKTNTYDSTH